MTDATKDALDALCAEHVMGWKKINRIEWGWGDGPLVWGTGDIVNPTKQNWSPTRDANAMLEVVERMREQDPTLTIHSCGEEWEVLIGGKGDGPDGLCLHEELGVAVVLAALRAKSVPLPETKEQ